MSEYICSWEELDAVILRAIRGEIESIKEVYDVVTSREIVRCRDCRYCNDEGVYEPALFCTSPHWNDGCMATATCAEGFCAWGERNA